MGAVMKLTNKHIAALKEARKLIASEDEDYICLALDRVYADPRLRRRIERLLGLAYTPAYTLEDWLLDHPSDIDEALLTADNLRAYRLRWIDHMIATREL
jgi:hypothetical protein